MNGAFVSSSNFSVTRISQTILDAKTGYPVLAIWMKYTQILWSDYLTPILSAELGFLPPREEEKNYLSINKQVYAKDSMFLITGEDDHFKWISPENCNLFIPQLPPTYRLGDRKRLTRYSANEELGEITVIIPMRQFSITGITEEGFDSEKGYSVLAIDIDQYFPETNEEQLPKGEQVTHSMAFFLVANDVGEFIWIAEDECRLYSIDS
jgi:hypothetical protein